MLNLIVNARDAMPDGGKRHHSHRQCRTRRRLRARRIPDRAAALYVSLAVADTGIGMDEHVKARIFEPFFTTKGENQGTGLGLAIVYGVVKQTGSYIAVDSEVNRGTTFTVYFPRAKAPLADLQPAEPATAIPTVPQSSR